jgi:hypothetical protein
MATRYGRAVVIAAVAAALVGCGSTSTPVAPTLTGTPPQPADVALTSAITKRECFADGCIIEFHLSVEITGPARAYVIANAGHYRIRYAADVSGKPWPGVLILRPGAYTAETSESADTPSTNPRLAVRVTGIERVP